MPRPWNCGLATGLQDDSSNRSPGAPGGMWLNPFMKERVREHTRRRNKSLGLMREVVWPSGSLPGDHCRPCQSQGDFLGPPPGRHLWGMLTKKAFQSMMFLCNVGHKLGVPACCLPSPQTLEGWCSDSTEGGQRRRDGIISDKGPEY